MQAIQKFLIVHVFYRKIRVLVMIISTRWRMYRSVRFTLAIIATSASSRSIPLCRGLLVTCSLVRNPQDPLPKLSGKLIFQKLLFHYYYNKLDLCNRMPLCEEPLMYKFSVILEVTFYYQSNALLRYHIIRIYLNIIL